VHDASTGTAIGAADVLIDRPRPPARRPAEHGGRALSADTYEGSAWSGWVIFAAAVMFTIGAIDIIQQAGLTGPPEVTYCEVHSYLTPGSSSWSHLTSVDRFAGPQ
jgi:hypothetical protein